MENRKIYEGNEATGYKTTVGNTVFTVSEETARRDGVIKGAVPNWALCCGDKLPR